MTVLPAADTRPMNPHTLTQRLTAAHGTPEWNDELATTAAVITCAGYNGVHTILRTLTNELVNARKAKSWQPPK